MSYRVTYLLLTLSIFLVTKLVSQDPTVLRALGLVASLPQRLAVGFLSVVPLAIGGALLHQLAQIDNVPNLVAKTVVDPFFEELVFRGYFFGLLFRTARLGFLPSVVVCSLIFAAGHLYQTTTQRRWPGYLLPPF